MQKSHSNPFQCLWCAYDEYGKFPATRYGAFNLSATPTMYDLMVIDGPEDEVIGTPALQVMLPPR
jgi:hypothetical protein